MTKYERVKLWVKNNEDKIIVVGFGTVMVGLLIVAVKSSISYQERMSMELNGYIDELNALYMAKDLS